MQLGESEPMISTEFMKMLKDGLLITGLIFPAVSAVTCILSVLTRLRHKRYASPICIPFAGPALLTFWVLVTGVTHWLIPLVWILDIGTMLFLPVLPRLIFQWWQLSTFTRLITLRASSGSEHVLIRLHRGGRYLLTRSWDRSRGETGVLAMSEAGTFTDSGEAINLVSDTGLRRSLNRIQPGTFEVIEYEITSPEQSVYSLHGWRVSSSLP